MNSKRILRYLRNLIIFFFASTILSVIALRFIPVYITPLMVIRSVEQLVKGEELIMKHKWVPKEKISRHLPMAVIASEENKKRKKARGASTISQQTAKNVFLWPSSSWIRKGFEVYFTVLIELMWDKERIMEVYLNSIEMGDGIYGAEAVAKAHFHTTASQLTRKQCALIAASLPNPRKYNSGKPSPYMYKRQRKIMYLMKCVPTFPEKSKK